MAPSDKLPTPLDGLVPDAWTDALAPYGYASLEQLISTWLAVGSGPVADVLAVSTEELDRTLLALLDAVELDAASLSPIERPLGALPEVDDVDA